MAYDADADRRSGVSSYQRGGRPSVDRMSQVQPPPPGAYQRATSPHSLYSQQPSQHPASAGYNQASFSIPGRAEPVRQSADEEAFLDSSSSQPFGQSEPWDVYADFNNQGPKYSSNYAQPTFSNSRPTDKGYRPIRGESKSEAPDPAVELVTVPAFGAEWKQEELRGMTKSGKKEAKTEKRRAQWKYWMRDQYGFCGGWATRKTLVFFLFGFCIFVGILLAVLIPRVPSFSFNTNTPFQPVNASQLLTGPNTNVNEVYKNAFSRTPANFSFPAWLNLQVDTHADIIPTHFHHIEAQVYDANTLKLVATGEINSTSFPAKKFIPFLFPLQFSYQAVNASDITWLNWYNACRNSVNYVGGTRPGVDARLVIFMKIAGLPRTAGTSTQISGVPCPIELPTDSV